MLFRVLELRHLPRAHSVPTLTICQKLKAAVHWLNEWIESCADHYAAAKLYETLSRLSDAELAHRGLSRETLAHDLIRKCEQRPANTSGSGQ